MPTWSDILGELVQSKSEGNQPQFDGVRRKYLVGLSKYTKRDTILYASRFTQSSSTVSPEDLSITDGDLQGFMEVVHGLQNPNLDFIIHSPGGSIEAASGLVYYLRSKFSNIRVIVPHLAMSALVALLRSKLLKIILAEHIYG